MSVRKRKLLETVLVWSEGELHEERRVVDQDKRIRAALVRLLWNAVADEATCVCEGGDPGPECEAWRALYGRMHWPGPKAAEKRLAKEAKYTLPRSSRLTALRIHEYAPG